MKPQKIGGGNNMQEYDPKTGEYCNEQCESDRKNLILQILFNVKSNNPIVYPIPNIHDKSYCELYISYCVDKANPLIEDQKFTNYLFIPNKDRDKSVFLESMGYNINNYLDLIDQIKKNTMFNNIYEIKNTDYCLSFLAKTKIKNIKKNRIDIINTIWSVEKNNTIRFITLKGDK